MNKKLIIIIAAIILILLFIAVGLVMAVRRQNEQPAPAEATSEIIKVVDEAVVSPIPSFDNTAIWYFTADGRLFRKGMDGALLEASMPVVGATAKQALWAPIGSDFILVTAADNSELKKYYSDQQKIYANLPVNMQSVDWLPDGKRIVYIWKSGDNVRQTLVTAAADGSGFKTIKEVFWPDLIVKASPDGKNVLLYRAKPEGDVNRLYLANLETGNISTLISQGKTVGAVWINAQRFVYAQSGITAYPKVYVYDFTTQTSVDLDLNTTLDKIAVDKEGKFLYAAVPKKDNTGDTFIKLDLTTYKQENYSEPEGSVRGKNLMVVGNSLYFINSADGKLYQIKK